MGTLDRRTAHLIVGLAQDAADASVEQIEEALHHVLGRLALWIGAANGYWMGALQEESKPAADPLLGWRSRDLLYLSDHESMIAGSSEMVARIHAGEVDPATAITVRHAGRTRAMLRSAVVPDEEWGRSWIVHEYQRPRGVFDQLVGTNAVGARRESHIGLTRGARDRPFGETERDLLMLFQSASRLFHRRVMLFRGLGSTSKLTLRERDVLRLLATARTETEIAKELDIGPRTVHQHALSIYGKLGVKGRLGLFTLLAGGGESVAKLSTTQLSSTTTSPAQHPGS
jgi:DNA-binding CsgD family transcriptional regulator